jgi:hypothetical protein
MLSLRAALMNVNDDSASPTRCLLDVTSNLHRENAHQERINDLHSLSAVPLAEPLFVLEQRSGIPGCTAPSV